MKNSLSKHISYKEATRSLEAARNALDNTPNSMQWSRMKLLAENVFEPLREALGQPIYIHSFFRSPKINKLVGGSLRSQHKSENGSAMDIDGQIFGGVTNIELFNYIRINLDFDQLILENINDNEDADWVHVSYTNGKNRKEVLVMFKDNDGKIKYAPFSEEKGCNLWSYRSKRFEISG